MKRFFYTPTAIEWLKAAAFTAVVLTPALVQAQDDPSAPSNLKAVADYNKVTLTWQRDVVSDTLYKQGFEEAGFRRMDGHRPVLTRMTTSSHGSLSRRKRLRRMLRDGSHGFIPANAVQLCSSTMLRLIQTVRRLCRTNGLLCLSRQVPVMFSSILT